jgi:dsDNA-specific endonuclease/ATPase MutS2
MEFGKLFFSVKSTYPSIKSYYDAPQNQGGFGDKIIKF